MHWYDDLPHIGYNMNGKKVLRPARGDELDKFLETVEDPESWYVLLLRLLHLSDMFNSGQLPLTRNSKWISLLPPKSLT